MQRHRHPFPPFPPFQIPDELTDEERQRFSNETAQAVAVHARALINVLAEFGIKPTPAEMTEFCGQMYQEGFRGRIARHSLRGIEPLTDDDLKERPAS